MRLTMIAAAKLSVIISNFANQMVSLYHNEGNGLFVDEASAVLKVGRATLVTLGFGCFFFGYDNDGWPDIFVADGHIEDQDRARAEAQSAMPNLPIFSAIWVAANSRKSRRRWGQLFAAPRVARGAAYADIDNSGYLDVLVTTNSGSAYLFHNEGGIKSQPATEIGWDEVES